MIVASAIDWLVWLILLGKYDMVEKLVESVEEHVVLQFKREYPYDHKMCHKGFVNKVGRG